jgi:hypothetical protein
MVTRAQNKIVKPRVFTDGRVKYPISRALLVVTDSALEEPTCYSNAIKLLEWRQTMQVEFPYFRTKHGPWFLHKLLPILWHANGCLK